ncbi:hypothetical protein RF11_07228 [Thelohanellus kitauei]|uniref:Uncharacterized protein n=1 Tax=Thelohanellus kitauei TaxID=669202 RepID=A0A0C2N8J3_THEKT|nr:hypothetical protein RF11_07228 [Thelohanellus kitauei]
MYCDKYLRTIVIQTLRPVAQLSVADLNAGPSRFTRDDTTLCDAAEYQKVLPSHAPILTQIGFLCLKKYRRVERNGKSNHILMPGNKYCLNILERDCFRPMFESV